MGWRSRTVKQMHEVGETTRWKDFPKWLRFKIKLMNFIWDWLTWDAVRSGWFMPRMQFRRWLFYKRQPYLTRDYY